LVWFGLAGRGENRAKEGEGQTLVAHFGWQLFSAWQHWKGEFTPLFIFSGTWATGQIREAL